MSNSYDLGALVRVSAAFTDIDGTPQDPNAVNVSVRKPDGTVTDYIYLTDVEVVRDAAGIYHMDIDGDQDGVWYYRWYSTGSGQAASEGYFYVRPGAVP